MKKNTKKSNGAEAEMIIGICLGVALGIVFDKLLLFIPIGVCLGVLFTWRNHKDDE